MLDDINTSAFSRHNIHDVMLKNDNHALTLTAIEKDAKSNRVNILGKLAPSEESRVIDLTISIAADYLSESKSESMIPKLLQEIYAFFCRNVKVYLDNDSKSCLNINISSVAKRLGISRWQVCKQACEGNMQTLLMQANLASIIKSSEDQIIWGPYQNKIDDFVACLEKLKEKIKDDKTDKFKDFKKELEQFKNRIDNKEFDLPHKLICVVSSLEVLFKSDEFGSKEQQQEEVLKSFGGKFSEFNKLITGICEDLSTISLKHLNEISEVDEKYLNSLKEILLAMSLD